MFPQQYLIRKKIIALFEQKFHFKDLSGNVLAFSVQKAFKLKEDIRIYSDETKTREILIIKARNVIDFSAAYDVIDPATGRVCGTWRRKGFSSLVRDSWELLQGETLCAKLSEDSMFLALVRRFLFKFIPQSYHLNDVNGRLLALYSQNFNPFVFKLRINNQSGQDGDMGLLIAAGGVLLTAIEGRQN